MAQPPVRGVARREPRVRRRPRSPHRRLSPSSDDALLAVATAGSAYTASGASSPRRPPSSLSRRRAPSTRPPPRSNTRRRPGAGARAAVRAARPAGPRPTGGAGAARVGARARPHGGRRGEVLQSALTFSVSSASASSRTGRRCTRMHSEARARRGWAAQRRRLARRQLGIDVMGARGTCRGTRRRPGAAHRGPRPRLPEGAADGGGDGRVVIFISAPDFNMKNILKLCGDTAKELFEVPAGSMAWGHAAGWPDVPGTTGRGKEPRTGGGKAAGGR